MRTKRGLISLLCGKPPCSMICPGTSNKLITTASLGLQTGCHAFRIRKCINPARIQSMVIPCSLCIAVSSPQQTIGVMPVRPTTPFNSRSLSMSAEIYKSDVSRMTNMMIATHPLWHSACWERKSLASYVTHPIIVPYSQARYRCWIHNSFHSREYSSMAGTQATTSHIPRPLPMTLTRF